MVSGFHHTLAKSRFKTGRGTYDISSSGFAKSVGDEGVFATRTNGLVMAIPNAGAPATLVPPLSNDADKHNQRVLAYFRTAGIPPDQIIETRESAAMRATGHETASGSDIKTVFDSFTTILLRGVQGFPVVGSYAWARFNVDDDVVSEEIFWPTLPDSVVGDAVALSILVADPGDLARFRARIGVTSEPARVVIRHSAATADGAFEVAAVFDVLVGVGSGATYERHFNIDGTERRFPEETPTSLNPSTR